MGKDQKGGGKSKKKELGSGKKKREKSPAKVKEILPPQKVVRSWSVWQKTGGVRGKTKYQQK